MGDSSARLDAFTDAAFAFAVTLLVIGGGEAPTSYDLLADAMAEVPAFAIGFAIITMFWFAHLRWRRYRGEGDWLSALLTVLLVFLVLVYIQPLRAMARSFSTFLGGSGTPFEGRVGDLFFVYGLGFIAMAATTVALFLEAQRNARLTDGQRWVLRGEMWHWVILVATGAVSLIMTCFDSVARFAPLAYATLPLTIGLFAWNYDWGRHDRLGETE